MAHTYNLYAVYRLILRTIYKNMTLKIEIVVIKEDETLCASVGYNHKTWNSKKYKIFILFI